VNWSKHDIATLKLSAFWGDTAEEIAYMLGKDPHDVAIKASQLGLRLARLHDIRRMPTTAPSRAA
jgi:hypothetical protein